MNAPVCDPFAIGWLPGHRRYRLCYLVFPGGVEPRPIATYFGFLGRIEKGGSASGFRVSGAEPPIRAAPRSPKGTGRVVALTQLLRERRNNPHRHESGFKAGQFGALSRRRETVPASLQPVLVRRRTNRSRGRAHRRRIRRARDCAGAFQRVSHDTRGVGPSPACRGPSSCDLRVSPWTSFGTNG